MGCLDHSHLFPYSSMITEQRQEVTKTMIDQFAEKYYTDDDGEMCYYYMIGEVYACFNENYHWYIQDIFTALNNNIPKEVVYEWYDYQEQLKYDSNEEKNPTNLLEFRK